MIKEKLKTWEYYEEKIPLLIKNSGNLIGAFKMDVDFLACLDDVAEDLFTQLSSITDNNVNNSIYTDLLDKIASFYGISRYVHAHYMSSGVMQDEDLTLSNAELLQYIRCRIAQNSFQGTREDVINIYNKLGLNLYMLNDTAPASVVVYLDATSELSNLGKMLKTGLITLESMGISYKYEVLDMSKLAHWDSMSVYDNSNSVWGY